MHILAYTLIPRCFQPKSPSTLCLKSTEGDDRASPVDRDSGIFNICQGAVTSNSRLKYIGEQQQEVLSESEAVTGEVAIMFIIPNQRKHKNMGQKTHAATCVSAHRCDLMTSFKKCQSDGLVELPP